MNRLRVSIRVDTIPIASWNLTVLAWTRASLANGRRDWVSSLAGEKRRNFTVNRPDMSCCPLAPADLIPGRPFQNEAQLGQLQPLLVARELMAQPEGYLIDGDRRNRLSPRSSKEGSTSTSPSRKYKGAFSTKSSPRISMTRWSLTDSSIGLVNNRRIKLDHRTGPVFRLYPSGVKDR